MTRTARQTVDASASEDDLLQAIVEAALFLGWKCHHDRRSDLARQQGTPGFPDLVLAKSGTLLMLELKSESGRLTPEQLGWAQAIGIRHRVVRPSDLDVLLRDLADLG